jgi:tRNA threonylcarbamoyladenosine biosynthesis protein TsaE
MSEQRIEVINSDEMERLGENLARELLEKARSGAVLVQLNGDLGAGKTTLTRGMARGLEIEGRITSPTFTVHKEYMASDGKTRLHHFDFYRLKELGVIAGELKELLGEPGNIIVVEWGGVLGELANNAKVIEIRKAEDDKRVVLGVADVVN